MDEIKLKPCPFCGGPARLCGECNYYWVECEFQNGCLVGPITDSFCTECEAIEAWNRRADNG